MTVSSVPPCADHKMLRLHLQKRQGSRLLANPNHKAAQRPHSKASPCLNTELGSSPGVELPRLNAKSGDSERRAGQVQYEAPEMGLLYSQPYLLSGRLSCQALHSRFRFAV